MSRFDDAERFIIEIRRLQTPRSLEKLVSDMALEMSFDYFSLFQHVSLSGISPSLGHMRRGELLGLTSAAVSWLKSTATTTL